MRVVGTTMVGVASAIAGAFLVIALFHPAHPAPLLIALASFGAIWGGGMGAAGAYVLTPLSLFGLFLDLNWSLMNTVVAIPWLIRCLFVGELATPSTESERSGTLVISNAPIVRDGTVDATTFGNVIGGIWIAHEEVHVWQARIFGPLYWFIYLLSYCANVLVRVITFQFDGLHDKAYARDVMEDWAYLACPSYYNDGFSTANRVFWGWWMLGLACAAFHALCIVLIAGSIPGVRNGVPTLHMGFTSALFGLLGILVFAGVRAFLPDPRTHRPPRPAFGP